MLVKERLNNSINNLIRQTNAIIIEYGLNEDIVTINYDNDKFLSLTTSGFYRKWTKDKKPGAWRQADNQRGRNTIYLALKNGPINGTRIPFARILGVAHYIYENDAIGSEFNGFSGMEVNHMDASGNYNRLGFVNEALYNLELCGATENKKHLACINRLKKLFSINFAISANDKELIEIISNKSRVEIINYINNLKNNDLCVKDKNNTYYLGKAASKLKLYKQCKRIRQAREIDKLLRQLLEA